MYNRFAVLFRTFVFDGRLNIVRQKEGDANSLQSVTILKKKKKREKEKKEEKNLCCYHPGRSMNERSLVRYLS